MGFGRQRKPEDEVDEVTVHVSFYGGLYVDPGELLRSKAAQNNIRKMCDVFGPRSLDAGAEGRPEESLAASRQLDSGDSGAR